MSADLWRVSLNRLNGIPGIDRGDVRTGGGGWYWNTGGLVMDREGGGFRSSGAMPGAQCTHSAMK